MGTILTLPPPPAGVVARRVYRTDAKGELRLVGTVQCLGDAAAYTADELRQFGAACVGEPGPEASAPAPTPAAPAAPAGRRALSLGRLEP